MHITQGPQFNGKASKRLHVMAKLLGRLVTLIALTAITSANRTYLSTKKAARR